MSDKHVHDGEWCAVCVKHGADEARAPLVAALEMVRDWQDLDSPEGIAIMLHEVRAALSREERL